MQSAGLRDGCLGGGGLMVSDGGQPELPYAGTSGWSGSETSRSRAERADTSGVTGKRQRETLRLLDLHGERGLTWQELAAVLGVHHGAASGVLSGLHTAGRIDRLTEVRNRCKVYVLPQHVAGRATEAYRRNRRPTLPRTRAEVSRLIAAGGADVEDLEGLLSWIDWELNEEGSGA